MLQPTQRETTATAILIDKPVTRARRFSANALAGDLRGGEASSPVKLELGCPSLKIDCKGQRKFFPLVGNRFGLGNDL